MDWNALKTFRAIARQGTLAGAARELGVNHSTVFRRLNDFEKALGGRVFERLKDGYQMTATGEALWQRSDQIELAFAELEHSLMGQDLRPQGNVVITAPDNLAYSYLPKYLAEFRQLYPEVTLELIVSNESFSLTRREADVAVRAADKVPEHLVGHLLGSNGWSFYASESWQGNLPETLDEIADFPLIGGEGHMAQLPPFRWLNKHYGDQQVIRSNNLVAMAAMAEACTGLALLPDDQGREGIKRLFECAPVKPGKLWVLTHPDLRHVERIKLLMNHLRESFKQDERLRFS